MIVECSQCQTRFLVPDQAIGLNGRTLRCGKCQHSWFQELSTEAAKKKLPELEALLSEINTQTKPLPKGSNLPKVPKSPVSLTRKLATAAMGLAASALLVLAFAPGLYGMQPSRGLVLADVGILREAGKDKRVSYQISGTVTNTANHPIKMPTLRITLVDQTGNAIRYWDKSSEQPFIEAKGNFPFVTESLEVRSSLATRFVVEIGTPLELALRRKPG